MLWAVCRGVVTDVVVRQWQFLQRIFHPFHQLVACLCSDKLCWLLICAANSWLCCCIRAGSRKWTALLQTSVYIELPCMYVHRQALTSKVGAVFLLGYVLMPHCPPLPPPWAVVLAHLGSCVQCWWWEGMFLACISATCFFMSNQSPSDACLGLTWM